MTPFGAPSFGLVHFYNETPLAPLAVVGYWLRQRQWLTGFADEITWPMQVRQHAPHEKLQDAFVAILAGCTARSQIDTTLRPDRVLAQAWGRRQVADPSGVRRLLTRFIPQPVEHLRAIHRHGSRQHGQAPEAPSSPGYSSPGRK